MLNELHKTGELTTCSCVAEIFDTSKAFRSYNGEAMKNSYTMCRFMSSGI